MCLTNPMIYYALWMDSDLVLVPILREMPIECENVIQAMFINQGKACTINEAEGLISILDKDPFCVFLCTGIYS